MRTGLICILAPGTFPLNRSEMPSCGCRRRVMALASSRGPHWAANNTWGVGRNWTRTSVAVSGSPLPVRYLLLEEDLADHARLEQWGSFRNAMREMAEILRRTSDPRSALEKYLEVCYLDLNGPSNLGTLQDGSGTITPIRVRGFPPWNPRAYGQLAPVIEARVSKLVENLGLERAEVHSIFMLEAQALQRSLRWQHRLQ